MSGFRSLGDLSTSFLFSRQTQALKMAVQRHASELTTGRTADVSQALTGDYRALSAIEARLAMSEAERIAIGEARLFGEQMQVALDRVGAHAEQMSELLFDTAQVPTAPTLDRVAVSARQAFEAIVDALNQKGGDRALFAGDATDGRALAQASDMLAELGAQVASETTASGVVAAVEAWFATPGGGFEQTGYIGSTQPLAEFGLASGETVEMGVTAADSRLRAVLKATALAALADAPALASLDQRLALADRARDAMLTAKDELTDLQADVGAAQAAVQASSVRLDAETYALQKSRNDLIGVDAFDAATRLEAAQTQLETLYALTARVSRMSLVDFLR